MNKEYYSLYIKFYQNLLAQSYQYIEADNKLNQYCALGIMAPPSLDEEIKQLLSIIMPLRKKTEQMVVRHIKSSEYQEDLLRLKQQHDHDIYNYPSSDTDDDERSYRRAGYDC